MDRTTNQDEAIAAIRKQFGTEQDCEQSPRTKNVFLRYSSGHTFTISKSGYVICLHPSRSKSTDLGFIARHLDETAMDVDVAPRRRKARHPRAKRSPEYLHTLPGATRQDHSKIR